ncbi:transcription factor bHLH18-like [Neltuma alba]|uniref:transcription factor bHLH18-like n=1 Tax=Neltuma alba TaxID=207710 RepID=UPI0010A58617|nr:transcription factor bHLH18-like [Prosopis alba]
MEISAKYFAELDPSMFEQYPVDCMAYEVDDFQDLSGCGDSYSCFHSKRSRDEWFPVESPESVAQQGPAKQLKSINNTSWAACTTTTTVADPIVPSNHSASNSTSQIISFDNSNSSPDVASHQFYSLDSSTAVKPKTETIFSADDLDFSAPFSILKPAYEHKPDSFWLPHEKKTAALTRNPLQAKDHVMAERKRREKLCQRFIALSAILPGLKKMDKASVLGDAINYVKQLQERVQTLEEQVAKKAVETAVFVNRSVVYADDDGSSSDENSNGCADQSLPEIEARVSGKEVLIRIHCDKRSGSAATILSQLQHLHLTVQSSSFLPFGNTTLDITIVAQMNKEERVTAKDVVRSLRQGLRNLI